MDIQISDEQNNIAHNFQKGLNLSIVAVAGAGKTTTILILSQLFPDKEFLILTYNRRLSDETKNRIKSWNIKNAEMQTYHGFCTKYFGSSHNDAMMSRLSHCSPQLSLAGRLKMFNVLIIDEMQDMNELYYNFVHDKLKYMNDHLQIVLLGDPRQTIYQFNGGNDKYLLEPETYWNRSFTTCYLETTYRLPPKITRTVNTLICSQYPQPFQMKCINKKLDFPVDYYFVDIYWGGQNIILKQINDYGLNGVLLIACSVKEKTPIYRCLNKLSEKGINMCVLKDDEISDPEVLKNKLVASSIHKQKGCERRCVIIYGLDCSYHKYYGKNKPINEYLNLIYVACTRSLEKLVIIGDKNHGYLKNWNDNDISSLIYSGDMRVYGKPLNKCDCTLEYKCQCGQQTYRCFNVTDIIKYRPFASINEFITQPSVKITHINGSELELTSENKATMQNGLVEHVSTVYGVLIPIIVEYYLYGQIRIIDYILSDQFLSDFQETQLIKHLNKDKRYEIFSIYDKINKSLFSELPELIDNFLNDFAFLSVCLLCYDSYVYLLYQIDNYDWIEKQYVFDCCQRLINFKDSFTHSPLEDNRSETKINKAFEMVCCHQEQIDVKLALYGRVDDLIGDSVVEYKISKNLGDHMHISQLLIYMWIMKKKQGYLYYPNLDSTIKVELLNMEAFDQFTIDWFNKLSIEYYQLMLKSKAILKPQKTSTKPKSLLNNVCLL